MQIKIESCGRAEDNWYLRTKGPLSGAMLNGGPRPSRRRRRRRRRRRAGKANAGPERAGGGGGGRGARAASAPPRAPAAAPLMCFAGTNASRAGFRARVRHACVLACVHGAPTLAVVRACGRAGVDTARPPPALSGASSGASDQGGGGGAPAGEGRPPRGRVPRAYLCVRARV